MHPIEIPAVFAHLLQFLNANRDGLSHAATLLGGPVTAQRVLRLIAVLSRSTAPRLSHRAGTELVALHRLLSLTDVSNPDRPEAHFFAAIAPADPVVEEICLLTDGLTEHLHGLIRQDLLDISHFDRAA